MNGIDKVEEIIADTAYGTKENIETCESHESGEVRHATCEPIRKP